MPLLHAQVATGDILGKVTDSGGSIIPGASIRVENIGTHQVRTFITQGSGEYVFSSLQPGTYVVTITLVRTSRPSMLQMSWSPPRTECAFDAALQVGAVDERVEVTATPTSLQTDSTTVGSTITERTLLDAPLNGRNFIGLVQVQAGVNAGFAKLAFKRLQHRRSSSVVFRVSERAGRTVQQQYAGWVGQQ